MTDEPTEPETELRPCFDCDHDRTSTGCVWHQHSSKDAHEVGKGIIRTCEQCGMRWKAAHLRLVFGGRAWGWLPVRRGWRRRYQFDKAEATGDQT